MDLGLPWIVLGVIRGHSQEHSLGWSQPGRYDTYSLTLRFKHFMAALGYIA